MYFLTFKQLNNANSALRKMEANFLRYHSSWQDSKGFGRGLRRKASNTRVDPVGKSDNQILDNYDLVMMGERGGLLNDENGFTEKWADEPRQRDTDGRYCIPIPPPCLLRDSLLKNLPSPGTIDTFNPEWWSPEGEV